MCNRNMLHTACRTRKVDKEVRSKNENAFKEGRINCSSITWDIAKADGILGVMCIMDMVHKPSWKRNQDGVNKALGVLHYREVYLQG